MVKKRTREEILADLEKKVAEKKRADKIWKPHEDSKQSPVLTGTVNAMRWIKSRDNVDDDGKPQLYLSVLVVDTKGELWVHNCGILLQSEFESQGVKPGWNVSMEYRGKDGRTGIFMLESAPPE